MPWSKPRPAVALLPFTDPPTTEYLSFAPAGSLVTRLNGDDVQLMFGGLEDFLEHTFGPSFLSSLNQPGSYRGMVGTPLRWVLRLRSQPLDLLGGGGEFELVQDESGAVDGVRRTGVPDMRRAPWGVTWSMTVVETSAASSAGMKTETEATDPDAVQLGHPHLSQIPDALGGGWLMVLRRTLAFIPGSLEVGAAPEPAIQDIVGYVCAGPTFRWSDVQGPYLLVHSLDAIPDAGFRVKVDVPGAEFVFEDGAWHLLLYYFVMDYTEPPGVQAYVPVIEGEGQGYEGREREHYEAVDDYTDANGADSVRATHVRTVSLTAAGTDLAGWLAANASTDEHQWTPSDAVPGTNQGPVRLWTPVGSLSAGIVVEAVDRSIADAAPRRCDGDDGSTHLALYARAGSVEALEGETWRCLLVEGGQTLRVPTAYSATHARSVLKYLPHLTTRGRDFVVPANPSIVRPVPTTRIFADPDPVVLPDGSVRVTLGAERKGTSGTTIEALQVVQYSGNHPCPHWTHVWSMDGDSDAWAEANVRLWPWGGEVTPWAPGDYGVWSDDEPHWGRKLYEDFGSGDSYDDLLTPPVWPQQGGARWWERAQRWPL